MKWAVRGDNPELKQAMVKTHSFALNGGMSVKILDLGFEKRRVRVLTNSEAQEELVAAKFERIVLMLDGDDPGRQATTEIVARLAPGCG